jgi:uncharacterized protein
MKKSSKILNDPIHGFIRLPKGIIYDLIEHPYFQRLRRISQLGLTNLVYPGANHTRFHHAIGAMHLMSKAIESLRSKGNEITEEEALAAEVAILLHDIGHGAFSHALEHSIADGIAHEQLSILFMHKLNKEFDNKLELAIDIFEGKYHKKYLHQLVSSQLDMDRLDYLKRDSFYSGVQEGIVGSERIIHMLNIVEGNLVIENKGIYSIEKFLIARRLMYWQVYFHKNVVCAEQMLIKTLQRAKELSKKKVEVFCTSSLKIFLENNFNLSDFKKNNSVFEAFANLDDYDVLSSIKEWQNHPDKILSNLSSSIIDRKLYKVKLENQEFDAKKITNLKEEIKADQGMSDEELKYTVLEGEISNDMYKINHSEINILFKDGTLLDLTSATDQHHFSSNNQNVKKYFICYPKDYKF